MALETLRGVKEIGGFEVNDNPQIGTYDKFIHINHDTNAITFTIQNGAIKENGVNGCQVDTLISAAGIIINELNSKFPCKENEDALNHIDECLKALRARKVDRENRGVEGYGKA